LKAISYAYGEVSSDEDELSADELDVNDERSYRSRDIRTSEIIERDELSQ
jgi:hypothetical protein